MSLSSDVPIMGKDRSSLHINRTVKIGRIEEGPMTPRNSGYERYLFEVKIHQAR